MWGIDDVPSIGGGEILAAFLIQTLEACLPNAAIPPITANTAHGPMIPGKIWYFMQINTSLAFRLSSVPRAMINTGMIGMENLRTRLISKYLTF